MNKKTESIKPLFLWFASGFLSWIFGVYLFAFVISKSIKPSINTIQTITQSGPIQEAFISVFFDSGKYLTAFLACLLVSRFYGFKWVWFMAFIFANFANEMIADPNFLNSPKQILSILIILPTVALLGSYFGKIKITTKAC